MELERVVGDIVKLYPTFEEMEILWMTREQLDDKTNPSMWFKYKDWMYLAVCDYEFDFLEMYEDWINDDGTQFDEWNPTQKEVNKLLSMNPIYFKVIPERIFSSDDLDNYCQFELDFIMEWNRDKKIGDILK